MFEVYDRITGKVMATYADRKKARAKVDRLDNAYGAYRYSFRTLEIRS
jgi:hypothetical protein